MQNTIMNVRCGKAPSESKLEYTFSTEEIRNYMEKGFQFVEDGLKKNLVKQGKDPNVIPHIVPQICLGCKTKRFASFLLILPESVLNRPNFNPNIPSVFQGVDDENVKLIQVYWVLIQKWAYRKESLEDFRNPSVRHALAIKNSSQLDFIMKYAGPRIEKLPSRNNPDGDYRVIIAVDPIRVFRDMLANKDFPNQRFDVFIEDINYVDESNAVFTVSRSVKKKRENPGDIKEILIKALRSKR